MKKFIHKKTGKPYGLVTDNFMFKENGEWRRGLVLYQALYNNPDGKFFARTPEDFFENFEEIDEVTDSDLKLVIEKELCHPTDSYTIPDPKYHVSWLNELTGEKEEVKVFDKDIKEAARFAEHELDVGCLAVAYKKDPDSFKSTLSNCSSISPISPTSAIRIEDSAFSLIDCNEDTFNDILKHINDFEKATEKENQTFLNMFEYVKSQLFKINKKEEISDAD